MEHWRTKNICIEIKSIEPIPFLAVRHRPGGQSRNSDLTRGKLASIDNLIRLFHHSVVASLIKGRSGQSHETSAGRLQDTEGGDEPEE